MKVKFEKLRGKAYEGKKFYELRIREVDGVRLPYSRLAATIFKQGRDYVVLREFGNKGTVIYIQYIATGRSQGGSTSSREEFILKQNETYLFELESDAAANILSGALEWYEHTDKH